MKTVKDEDDDLIEIIVIVYFAWHFAWLIWFVS
jgi:hypothetical protein